ncbi:hypothetical protein [Streptomyces sp. MS06]|uniref:hypothetical protein n=1 Tax=Streptomyces sp. MS06 TaxID=3385974 RepID=UPI0039A2132C
MADAHRAVNDAPPAGSRPALTGVAPGADAGGEARAGARAGAGRAAPAEPDEAPA